MKIYRIRSFREWQEHSERMTQEYNRYRDYQKKCQAELNQPESTWILKGFSYPAKKEVDFLVFENRETINWRETLVCPRTKLNNRARSSLHIFDIECSPYCDDSIYLTEQTTAMYRFLDKEYQNVVGSEFFGEDKPRGELVNGIRHEDVTQLSFTDSSLKHILSFDVFEHVPNYLKGLEECYRVLCPGGNLLWTIPFIRQNEKNLVRAKVKKDGSIDHILEPEYHGDPIKPEGLLCFYHFGWELLDQVREIGFRDVYAVLFWSDTFGYLGPESIVFIARK